MISLNKMASQIFVFLCTVCFSVGGMAVVSTPVEQTILTETQIELKQEVGETVAALRQAQSENIELLKEAMKLMQSCDETYALDDESGYSDCYVSALYDVARYYATISNSYDQLEAHLNEYHDDLTHRVLESEQNNVSITTSLKELNVVLDDQSNTVRELIGQIESSDEMTEEQYQAAQLMIDELNHNMALQAQMQFEFEMVGVEVASLNAVLIQVGRYQFEAGRNATQAERNEVLVQGQARITRTYGRVHGSKQELEALEFVDLTMPKFQAKPRYDKTPVGITIESPDREGLLQALKSLLEKRHPSQVSEPKTTSASAI